MTDLLHAGENEITVYTDDRAKPNSRWYVGCGIYRHVWLHMAAPVSVAPHGLRVTTTKLEGGCATLDIRAELTGRADSVTYTLVDGDGQTVASVTGGEQATLEVTGITPGPRKRLPSIQCVPPSPQTAAPMWPNSAPASAPFKSPAGRACCSTAGPAP